jgi:hypothetical protein
MYINIITPCIRPENLHDIAKSIIIPKEQYQWLVVHDADTMPDIKLLPTNAIHTVKKVEGSISGNGQRNRALDIINTDNDSWIYFNDDDTAIQPELFQIIEQNQDKDFIHFQQAYKTGEIRLNTNIVEVTHIDSHNFIFKAKLLENTRWKLGDYCADGYFAKEIYLKAKNSIYIEKILSIHNSLR